MSTTPFLPINLVKGTISTQKTSNTPATDKDPDEKEKKVRTLSKIRSGMIRRPSLQSAPQGDSFSLSRTTGAKLFTMNEDRIELNDSEESEARLDTTEAKPEHPPFKLYDPLERIAPDTDAFGMPRISIPSTIREEEDEGGQRPEELSLGRHKDKADAVFSFLLDKRK
jgi:hypothetical protein